MKFDIATTSKERLLIVYGPKNCMKFSRKVRIIQDVFNNSSPTIGTMHREKSREFTEGLVMGWLVYLNDILNLNKPMSEDQIEMCAITIVDEYYSLNFMDLTLIFKRIISGDYGEFYESLSIPKVLSFFKSYYEERLTLAYEINHQNHLNEKSDETFNISKNIRRTWYGTPSR